MLQYPVSEVRPAAPAVSGDDVRRDLILDEGNAVAQLQLALLQALQPQQIGSGRMVQRFDGDIKIAVLLLQLRKLESEFVIVLIGHLQSQLDGR